MVGISKGIEVEMAILGCLLLMDTSDVEPYIVKINEEDFSYEPHKFIFRAIKNLVNKGRKIDPILVLEELKSMRKENECGGLPYLLRLQEFVPSATSIDDYIKTFVELKTKQKAIDTLQATAYKLGTLDGNWKSELVRSVNMISEMFTVDEDDDDGYSWEDLFEVLTEKQPLSTGMKLVDEVLGGGLRQGELSVICARPSVGKSAFLIHLVATHPQINGIFISYEMSIPQLLLRLLANMTQTSMTLLRVNKDLLAEKINYAFENIQINWVFKESLPLPEIEPLIKKMEKKDKKPQVILIDYLQLIPPISEKTYRYQEIGEITKFLKRIAMKYEIPVVVAAQLRREAEDKIPRLRDLRESGDVEQDADVIIGLHRPNDQTGLERKLVLAVLKNRQGDIGTFQVLFKPDMFTFIDLNETYKENGKESDSKNEDGNEREGEEVWLI